MINEAQFSKIYFSQIEEKLKVLSENFKMVQSTIENSSEFQNVLKENFQSKIANLTNYLNNFKIYIVFMGTTSSGKSTFINALLGQQLLPSRNQICTSQVAYIGHINSNDNAHTNILINEFLKKTIADARNPDLGTINIKTQSYYHTYLSKHLQDRVYFIDTPGINLSQCSLEQYVKHFSEINKLIELDEYSLRINVWITNYTTLDSDKKIQCEILSMLKNEDEQNQIQNKFLESEEYIKLTQNLKNSQIQQQIPFYFVLNKIDERKKSEDVQMEIVSQEIKDLFNSEQVFNVSALMAMRYIIMNNGTQDAQDKFIRKFFEDEKRNHLFVNLEKAKKHCQKKIKDNHYLMENQNFYKFTSQTFSYIYNVLTKIFDDGFIELSQTIIHFELGEQLAEARSQLTPLHKKIIAEFSEDFPQKMQKYKSELQNELNNTFFPYIDDQVAFANQQIYIDNPKTVISKTCQNIFDKIDHLHQNVLFKTLTYKKQLLDRLRSVLKQDVYQNQDQEQQLSIIIQKCEKMFQQFMESDIFKFKKQFAQNQATELQSKMGIIVSRSFFEKAYSAANLKFLIGTEIGTGLSVLGLIKAGVSNKPHYLIGTIAFNLCFQYSFQLFNQECSKLYIDKPLLTSNLNEWKLSLKQQIQELVDNYIGIYEKILSGISNLMEKIIH